MHKLGALLFATLVLVSLQVVFCRHRRSADLTESIFSDATDAQPVTSACMPCAWGWILYVPEACFTQIFIHVRDRLYLGLYRYTHILTALLEC